MPRPHFFIKHFINIILLIAKEMLPLRRIWHGMG